MPSKEMKRKIGQLFMIGFEGRNLHKPLKEMLNRYHVGGLVFFRRNISEARQVWEFIRSIKKPELLISVDHEGGRVHRFPEPVTHMPAAGIQGRHHSPDIVRKAAEIQGWELGAMGFNYSYSPVVDLWTNPVNTVIGDRAYGADPHEVAMLGCAAIQGLEDAGIASCAKHFPGHGDTRDDSHKTLPTVHTELNTLKSREFFPFQAAIGHGVRSVMVGHLKVNSLDATHPASLSREVVQTWLRGHLGFNGVVVSDDYEMEGSAVYSVEDRVLLAIEAGVDLLMFCRSMEQQVQAIETVYKAVDGGIIKEAQILQSHQRVQRLRQFASHVTIAGTPEELHDALTIEGHKRFAASIRI